MSLTNEKGILHTAPPGHMALQFASGKTSAFTCPSAWSSDSTGSQSTGASFYLYVPRDHPVSRRARASSDSSSARGTPEQASAKWPLLVLIHGSRRDAQGVRDRWADWAEEHGVVILCPLFPADLLTLNGVHNYKVLSYDGTRYDRLLLDMITYIGSEWGDILTDKFYLSGFSGGAQFAHRFWFLHAHRIKGVAIAAPGSVTLLEPERDWPRGIRGWDVGIEEMKRTPCLLVVGTKDVSGDYSRIAVLEALKEGLDEVGVENEMVRVPGAAHEEGKLMPPMQVFFRLLSDRERAET